jgi:hypothetical protein
MSNASVETPSVFNEASSVQLPERFQDLGLDRYFYKPESCREMPLVGILIGIEEFGRDKPDVKDHWDALVIRTTEPTKVVTKDEKGEDTVIDCPVGEEVMINVSDKLEKLAGYARHKTLMAEFFIQPLRKDVLEINPKTKEVTKSIWRYKVGGGQPIPKVSTTSWDSPALPAAAEAASDGGAKLPG